MNSPAKPLPRPSAITKPFWDGARASEIRVQKCGACGRAQHPPRPLCLNCWSDALEWIACSGQGEVYSYSVCHWATMPAFKDEVPYIVAIVSLAEGVRLNARIVNCPLDRIAIGLKVRPSFEKASEDITLVNFQPE